MKCINIGRDALNINDQNKLPLISPAAFCHWLRARRLTYCINSKAPFETHFIPIQRKMPVRQRSNEETI